MTPKKKSSPIIVQLRQLADEIRVQVHLAGMDAKDTWSRLEPNFLEFERKVATSADKVSDGLMRAGRQLEAEMRKLLGKLERPSPPAR